MNPATISIRGTPATKYTNSYHKEWLITNGLGGYASSTITGANTRGYHGLLVASLPPNLRRVLLLSKLEEEVTINGRKHPLSTNRYPETLYPDGDKYLDEFNLGSSANFIFRIGETRIKKTVSMLTGYNTSIISYELSTPNSVELNIRPLVNFRDFHSRTQENHGLTFKQRLIKGGTYLESCTEKLGFSLVCNIGEYEPSETWYRSMVYDVEAERGLPDREDHFSPGIFKVTLRDQDVFRLVASTELSETTSNATLNPAKHTQATGASDLINWLLHSADQFIVKLPDDETAIVAGYHWFGEWGRDTAIALPGLLLITGRFNEAKSVLKRYLQNTRNGLAPVYFDENMKPHYASIDTSLWLIYATHKYLTYTSDLSFVAEVYPKLREIIEGYTKGTEFSRVSEDHLLEATSEKYSLTWMDAWVEGFPVTPRFGKCVEVNALWYNALKSVEEISKRIGEEYKPYTELASEVKKSFNNTFWNEAGKYLYDCVKSSSGDFSLRPNQIFSISLPFPVLNRRKWGNVINNIEKHLLTPYGLRSLSPSDPNYRGICAGNPKERDQAYHNGTVWAWLAGPYISSCIKLGLSPSSPWLNDMLHAFTQHLYEGGLGNVSEIFDGDVPYTPRGCISQAWSVGELLRVISEDLGRFRKVTNT